MKLTKTQLKRIIKEELGRDAVTYYALIEIPYETSLILKESSLEELKAEIAGYGYSDAHVQAIFTADVIEGTLE